MANTGTRKPGMQWHISCFLLLLCITLATDPSTERGILEIFYYTCNGDSWNDKTNWIDPQMSICNWTGVECTNNGGDEEEVERLRLPGNNIACTLPKELFLLPNLLWLDLRSNDGIDADFTALNGHESTVANLEYLILSDTNVGLLDGIDVFSDSLTTLYMVGCELSGTFPESVFSLSALKHLDVAYNFLSGMIPDDIGELQDLRTLGLNHNFFNGQIPSSIGSLQRLTNVQMQFNSLTGTLPVELGDMFSLSFVTLHNQIQSVGDIQVGGITGPLPDFANLQFLFHIDLSNNRLTGTVPSSFLASLLPGFGFSTLFDLRSNRLSGELPSSLARFDSILAYLADNQIESVPDVLCQETDWLFGQVGEFGCNALLCPPGTFNPFGRQMSDGYPCWQCQTGESAPYFGSKSCVKDTPMNPLESQQDVWAWIRTNSPLQRLSHDATVSDTDGDFWRDGLDDQDTTGDVLEVQRQAISSGSRATAAMGTLAALFFSMMR